MAPKIKISDSNLNFTIQPSVLGRNYQLQWSDSMASGTWTDVGVVRSGDGGDIVISTPYAVGVRKRFYRVALVEATPAPAGFSLISAGSFQMGDQSNPLLGTSDELPVHSVYVSAFYMGKFEVTKELWDEVRAWGLNNGYTDLAAGNGSNPLKGANHPVHSINWHDAVKWCNARSEMDGLVPCYTLSGVTYQAGISAPECNWSANGYRLPTEAEWEKAARSGVSGKNFDWGTDTISHSQANYRVDSSDGTTNYYSCDLTPRPPGEVYEYYHPAYATGGYPYSSPVGSFAPNGYGLYDMAGNMKEWCWDWYGSYSSGSQTDPRGVDSGSDRVRRGGCWDNAAPGCRVTNRSDYSYRDVTGFRVARSSVP